jgi:AcrR family transcriptional regulator
LHTDVKDERSSKTEERRNQILNAATVCLARKGYYETKMDDIVAESGLSKGTLYLYFKSKKEIFVALSECFTHTLDARIVANLEGKTTLIERMRAMADAYVQTTRSNTTDASGNAVNITHLTAEFWQQAVIDPEIKARFVEAYHFYTKMSEDLVRTAVASGEFREVDIPTITQIVMAVFDGLTLRWLLTPDEVDWPHAIDVLFEVFLNGVRSLPTAG